MLITRSLGLGSLTGREKPEQAPVRRGGSGQDSQGERPRQLEKDGHRTLYQKRQEWVEPEPEAEAWNRVEYAQDGFPG